MMWRIFESQMHRRSLWPMCTMWALFRVTVVERMEPKERKREKERWNLFWHPITLSSASMLQVLSLLLGNISTEICSISNYVLSLSLYPSRSSGSHTWFGCECITSRNWCTPASESKYKFYAIRICCYQLSLPPRRHAKTAFVVAKYEHIARSEWETIPRDYKQ